MTTTKPKTKSSHAKFWALLKQTENYNEAYKVSIKEAWVLDFSENTFTSLSEFKSEKPFGYNNMLKALDNAVKSKNKNDYDRQNVQRKKLLALIYTYCNQKGYECTQLQAVNIATKACGVIRLNDAPEQKLIAAIKSFEDNKIDVSVDSVINKL